MIGGKTLNYWIGLMIGNSRLHWAWFEGKILKKTWDLPHLSHPLSPSELCTYLSIPVDIYPLYIASVVATQTDLWQNYPNLLEITLKNIPLSATYPTFGIDRALALWGAIQSYGCPCLVIDGGTALTFTGADSEQQLVGGAILPGLRVQFGSLASQTAALGQICQFREQLPSRWAKTTSEAIFSGVIYTILSGIKDFIEHWWQIFPHSPIIFTGGDGDLLQKYLQIQYPNIAKKAIVDPQLIFQAMNFLISDLYHPLS